MLLDELVARPAAEKHARASTGSTTTRACMMTGRSRWRWAAHTCWTLTRRREGWIRWARTEGDRRGGGHHRRPVAVPPERPAPRSPRPVPGPEPAQEPELEGVVLDAAAARKLARDQRYRDSPDGIALQYLSRG